METLREQFRIPKEWAPAKQAIALLLTSEAPDIHLIDDMYQRIHVPPKAGEGLRLSPTYLYQMENELDKIEKALGSVERPDMDRLGREADAIVKKLMGERLPGGCRELPHGWIWADAALNALANAIGYLFGSVAQSCIEDRICEDSQELPYGMRVLAELGNRSVQHLVRFLLRDVLFPWIKHACQWHSLQTERHLSPGQTVLLHTSIIAPLLAGDQIGVAILTNWLPSVPLQGPHQTPEKWENGAQMMVFAGTDFLAWVAANYFSQLCYGSASQVQQEPLADLKQKGVIHAAQVVMDGLILSGWKHAHDGLNPNSLCLPGIDTQRVRLYEGNVTTLPPLNRTETRQPMKYNDTHAIFPGALTADLGRAPEYRLYALYLDFTEIGTMLAIGNREAVGRIVAMAVVRCLVPQVFEGTGHSGAAVERERPVSIMLHAGGHDDGGPEVAMERRDGTEEIPLQARGDDRQVVPIVLNAGGEGERGQGMGGEKREGMEEVAIRAAEEERKFLSQFPRGHDLSSSVEDVRQHGFQAESSEEKPLSEGEMHEPNEFLRRAGWGNR